MGTAFQRAERPPADVLSSRANIEPLSKAPSMVLPRGFIVAVLPTATDIWQSSNASQIRDTPEKHDSQDAGFRMVDYYPDGESCMTRIDVTVTRNRKRFLKLTAGIEVCSTPSSLTRAGLASVKCCAWKTFILSLIRCSTGTLRLITLGEWAGD